MSKRDFISEIISKKQRSPDDPYKAGFKLYELQSNFQAIKGSEQNYNATLSLHLVGIVSCLEVAVRDAIRRLVDFGTPYVERIDKFKDLLRIDLNIAKALQDKKISFGDLISHLLQINNIEQIISHLDTLLDKSFKDELANIKEFREPSDSVLFGDEENATDSFENEDEEPHLLVPDVNILIASLAKLFPLRHIAAHEADFGMVLEEELEDFFNSSEIFINALEEIVEQTLYPNKPRFAFGASVIAAQEAGKVYAEMEKTYEKLLALVSEDGDEVRQSAIDELKAAQEAFQKYLEAETEFEETLISPGSGNTLREIDSHIMKSLCQHRIIRLNEVLAIFSYWDQN